ncbi:hypothetical protein BSKO_06300 [Bryopsis sp. KO-2023]|nr:hypothetical protein BSKO_06300 [Bryopsis sp. KO-2023]
MDAVTDFVKEKVVETVQNLAMPLIGKQEDIDKAKEIVGDKAKVYGALKAPEEALTIPKAFYCLFCFLPQAIGFKRRLENTTYIITDKGVKVHVDPYEPPLGIGDPSKDNKEIDLTDVSDIKIVKKKEGCMADCSLDKIVLEGTGVDLFVPDVDTVGDALKKVKAFADAGKGAAEGASKLAT